MLSPNHISFRDSVARVVKKETGYYRYIFQEYRLEYEQIMQSGLYDELTRKELLIKHQEVAKDTNDPKVYKLIYPDQILFQSYPFEWSYTQWQKAIIAYLKINQIALKYGMILKDATPLNFYLTGGKAVLLDTSSFIFFKNGDKWIAYKQFCSDFLAPLALMHYNGQKWAILTRTHLKGFPLQFISKQLPIQSWFNLNSLLHIHIHARYAGKKVIQANKKKNGFSAEKLGALLKLIKSGVIKWEKPWKFDNHWLGYYQNDIESSNYLLHKEKVITDWLKKIKPNTVVDLGANTGKFSFIACKIAKNVIALEADDLCIDKIEKEIEKKNIKNVTASVIDLTEPTGNIGALNKEIRSLYGRAESEMVLALAIIHHLHINNQFSFKQIAELLAMFTKNNVIVEFIPKSDNKVKLLLQDRSIDLSEYTEENFINAILEWFNVYEVSLLQDSERKLFLLEKINK